MEVACRVHLKASGENQDGQAFIKQTGPAGPATASEARPWRRGTGESSCRFFPLHAGREGGWGGHQKVGGRGWRVLGWKGVDVDLAEFLEAAPTRLHNRAPQSPRP